MIAVSVAARLALTPFRIISITAFEASAMLLNPHAARSHTPKSAQSFSFAVKSERKRTCDGGLLRNVLQPQRGFSHNAERAFAADE